MYTKIVQDPFQMINVVRQNRSNSDETVCINVSIAKENQFIQSLCVLYKFEMLMKIL